MHLTAEQYGLLSTMFSNLAIAMYITALGAPAVSLSVGLVNSMKAVTSGILFTYLALYAIRRKEELL